MTIKVIADPGNQSVIIGLKNAPSATRRGIRLGFFYLGKDLRQGARDGIKRAPKTGRLYRIRGRRARHRASAPGEDPANLTGKLRASVGFDVKGSDSMEFGYRGSVDYGAFLEEGTNRMKKRPALLRQVNETQANAREHFEREIARALQNPRG